MQSELKVLMIASDRNVFDENSAVAARMKDYGSLVKELHIVVMSDSKHGLLEKKLGENVWLYPTSSAASFLRPLAAARVGKKLIYEKKFVRGKSVITADSIEGGWAGLKIKRKWRLPLEVQLHTDPFSEYFSGFQNFVRKSHLSKVLKNADTIRVVSRSVADKLKENKIAESKIVVLPIIVDKEAIEAGRVSFDLHARFGWGFIMLAVARITSEKNLSLAIKVLSLLRMKYSDVGLVIVGSGPEESALKVYAKTLGVDKNVTFAGWQSDLTSFYKTANVFIQTSKFEGYGMALVEAGLSNLPIVTTPVGVANEFEDGKDLYICPFDDANYFANAVADLIDHNQKRENLRINMRHALESKLLSKEAYLAKLKEVWEWAAFLVK